MTFTATPVVPLSRAVTGDYEIWMKRDDLLPFSFGGNKVRIAEAFLADMRRQGADALIFYGDRRSNLCRVLANRCHIGRIPAIMIATEEHASPFGHEPFNSRLIRSFGIPVIDCAKTAIAPAVDEAFDRLKKEGYKPYYIYGDRTGSGNEGTAAMAYAAAYREILDFERSAGFAFDRIVTPYGTGATMSGLICGELDSGSDPRILGISISSRSYDRAFHLLKEGIAGYYEKTGRTVPAGYESRICLETAYNKGGYGLYDTEVTDLIDRMLKEEGIPMDPTYTAKAFAGLLHYLKDREAEGESFAGRRFLYLHTGGLPLFFDYISEER